MLSSLLIPKNTFWKATVPDTDVDTMDFANDSDCGRPITSNRRVTRKVTLPLLFGVDDQKAIVSEFGGLFSHYPGHSILRKSDEYRRLTLLPGR